MRAQYQPCRINPKVPRARSGSIVNAGKRALQNQAAQRLAHLLQGDIALRAWRTSSLSVATIMPSVTVVVQAVWSLGIFSIFTTHMRQAPCNESPG